MHVIEQTEGNDAVHSQTSDNMDIVECKQSMLLEVVKSPSAINQHVNFKTLSVTE